jgi:copper chaperone
MKTYTFKTSIKCNGCISTVAPHINALKGIGSWKVDISHPARILEIEAEEGMENVIMETIRKAGYQIEVV